MNKNKEIKINVSYVENTSRQSKLLSSHMAAAVYKGCSWAVYNNLISFIVEL
jgi:hypothetical protein